LIAVDSNILIYAHRDESHWHEAARRGIASLAQALSPWAIPWPCLHEFLAIVTHRKIYSPPTPLGDALMQVNYWRESPSLVLIGETPRHFETFEQTALSARIAGPEVHGAKIAAICLQHGVSELWTADRDFSRFPSLKTRNPLVA
jgi:toxin-antitoxin system PIN domain toxin